MESLGFKGTVRWTRVEQAEGVSDGDIDEGGERGGIERDKVSEGDKAGRGELGGIEPGEVSEG